MHTAISHAQPSIDFPPELPISARRAEIQAALARHQVIIVCGETGSGKTTQLPKMALALGRGQRGQRIGHTQPRRIAATSVAQRIANELHSELGAVVGYQIRFAERLQPGAAIKLMTDGVLLAETQGDPELSAYDTLIIDEAHERSLNIDFLLGYLRQLLPRRPDLKLIITSATLDADRFARHFADARGEPAPVLLVSGRTYPVEQRWRPFEESRDYGLNEALADAVDELWQGRPGGDVLVFLPGEREIREAANHLRKHLARDARQQGSEVLPLFGRLSQAEQARIFQRHSQPRIVLATNVAETSLTVPGIRYVVDAGTARVKRYSLRSKVERLLVEPISQAAANQRAGRCGRTEGGICIRLYDEADFNQRERFTDPEILRSSLAGVILRMKSLGLLRGEARVADFPFLEVPSDRAIADGYQLLGELGAVDEAGQLSDVGTELARLPLDPRVGRMILAGRERGALRETLIIASALSVQDVRDRPLQLQAQADQQHAKFDDAKSEFMGYLTLWQWLDDVRAGHAARSRAEMQARSGGKGHKTPGNLATLPPEQRAALALARARAALGEPEQGGASAPGHKLSNRQWEAELRRNFINVRRVREWRDVYRQLHGVASRRRWQENAQPAGYEAIHKALLSGLLGNVGQRIEAEQGARGPEYLGARGIKFDRHPGARLSKRPGRWIMCAELVQTSRLFGRGIASIDPRWLEEVAAHLIKRQVVQPHWAQKAGQAVALERGLLYGLVVYQGRRLNYQTVDPAGARELLIRQGLVALDCSPDWFDKLPFLKANRQLMRRIEGLEHKSRRQDLLVDDELVFAYYDQHIPADVADGRALQRWWEKASREQPQLLHLTREQLMRHEAAGVSTEDFPQLIRLGGVDCKASYLHEPGQERDGVTVTVPLFALNQVSGQRAQWLVPGMLGDKVEALLRSLPQRERSRLGPLPKTIADYTAQLRQPAEFGRGDLLQRLLQLIKEQIGADLKPSDFRLTSLPPHLLMNFLVTGEHGRRLGMGRNLEQLQAELGAQARGAFQALARLKKTELTAAAPQESPDAKDAPGARAGQSEAPAPQGASAAQALPADRRYTAWDFGSLPELLEIRRGKQTLFGYPALIDAGDAVMLEVFDEPAVARDRHRQGLQRLFALQVGDALRHLSKNIPDLHRMAMAYLELGTADELREQILHVALQRAFMDEPWPADTDAFAQRVEQGRPRLVLIAREVARLAGEILGEYTQAQRKIKAAKSTPDAARDASEQLARLMPAQFLRQTPWAALRHYPRYLQAIALRFDKIARNPERDTESMRAVQVQEQRFWRLVSERKGVMDAPMREFRWQLEELRVSLFAQELRTPHPVSVKRLDKAWARIVV